MFSAITNKFTASLSAINQDTGEELQLQNALTSVAIKKDFAVNVYPLYVLTMKLTETDRQYIVKNNVYFVLKINKYSVSGSTDQSSDESSAAPTITGIVIDETLKPFDKAKIIVTPNAADDIDADASSDSIKAQRVSYTAACIPMKELEYNNSIINACYSDANVNEACINIISNSYSGDIYYEESKNVNRYDSLLIPPMSLIEAIRYLNSAYELYDDEVSPFFDGSKFYVYDIRNKSRDFDNSFFINILKSEDNANKSVYQVPQLDDEDDVQLYLPNDPDISSTHDVYFNSIGGTAVFSSYDSEFNLVTRDYSNDSSTKKTRYFWNPLQKASYESRFLASFYQSISVGLPNFDPNIVNPGTKIIVSGSDLDDINGQYALIAEAIFFSTTDFSNYTGTETCVIAKY